ncbi:hypothetical protein ASPZODRAFT_1377031 [Penicilliopsis zonata CBS 506.65]|uniref:Uncharacterized protein n=1 Tax=Penicilliopsis zonata CBS 506.65 TaxID=1073090 RepID=A0A1L9SP80_9EURO|nr:hypothetical protein ASPZODRAFT_1377031 [Penicilliopsis zonata CBS 506.65]OJJ49008.1 hypothetical protein ASPZODRAFT_1377031 [Penicilliopsis zonata CBS 506.65]
MQLYKKCSIGVTLTMSKMFRLSVKSPNATSHLVLLTEESCSGKQGLLFPTSKDSFKYPTSTNVLVVAQYQSVLLFSDYNSPPCLTSSSLQDILGMKKLTQCLWNRTHQFATRISSQLQYWVPLGRQKPTHRIFHDGDTSDSPTYTDDPRTPNGCYFCSGRYVNRGAPWIVTNPDPASESESEDGSLPGADTPFEASSTISRAAVTYRPVDAPSELSRTLSRPVYQGTEKHPSHRTRHEDDLMAFYDGFKNQEDLVLVLERGTQAKTSRRRDPRKYSSLARKG